MELFAKTAVAVNITNIDLSMDSSGDEHAESEKATQWRHRPDSASLYHQSTLRTHPYTIGGPPPGASVTTTRTSSDRPLGPSGYGACQPPERLYILTPRSYKRSLDILPRTHTDPYV